MEKTVSNTTPKAILDACAEAGVDIRSLLSKASLTEYEIENPNGRIPFQDVIRLWETSYEWMQDRMIGVKAVNFIPFGAFKVVDYMMITSATPRDGLFKALKYYPLINEGFELLIDSKGELVFIELHNPEDPKVVPFQYVDFVFACVLSRIRFSTGGKCVPFAVDFTCSKPKDMSVYHKLFQAPIKFDQPVNRMIFENDSLEIVQPNADEYLCEMLDNYAQHLIKQLPPEKDVILELSRIMRKRLRETNLNHSARMLGMSRRSLQRKLKNRGVSYRQLQSKIRRELATSLLNQNVSIEETAFLVGYSEKSSFYRAFRQWTGKTPQDFLNH